MRMDFYALWATAWGAGALGAEAWGAEETKKGLERMVMGRGGHGGTVT